MAAFQVTTEGIPVRCPIRHFLRVLLWYIDDTRRLKAVGCIFNCRWCVRSRHFDHQISLAIQKNNPTDREDYSRRAMG
jgi:hypothetical protein